MNNNQKYIQSIVDAYNLNMGDDIAKRALEILRATISDEVYSRPENILYSRTMQLLNDIDVQYDKKNKCIYLMHNPKGGYRSWNPKYQSGSWSRYITTRVPYWTNYGHSVYDSNGIYIGYYIETLYMEKAKMMIEAELGVTVEIIDKIS